jgi:glucose-1-phosphate adenylyltransferase
LVADGCVIEGTVENSILFRGVKIAPNARINNCIIMQDGQVQEGAVIENCILDKQTVIKRNSRLIGPEAYPIVIAKNVVI